MPEAVTVSGGAAIALTMGARWRGYRASLTCDYAPFKGAVVYGYGETESEAVGNVVRAAITAAYEKGRASR